MNKTNRQQVASVISIRINSLEALNYSNIKGALKTCNSYCIALNRSVLGWLVVWILGFGSFRQELGKG